MHLIIFSRLDGDKRELDNIGPVIRTNRTSTTLNCASGYMNVKVEFDEPFYGIIYPNGSRSSACLTHGTGKRSYTIDLPLKGCNTKRVRIIWHFSHELGMIRKVNRLLLWRHQSRDCKQEEYFPDKHMRHILIQNVLRKYLIDLKC